MGSWQWSLSVTTALVKIILVTSWKRSLLPWWILSVFQMPILKLWRFWRIGMGLGLAASCTGLVSSCRAVLGKKKNENANWSLHTGKHDPSTLKSGRLLCLVHSYVWDNCGFPEDTALTFIVVEEEGVGTCTWNSYCKSCCISFVTHFNYHVWTLA